MTNKILNQKYGTLTESEMHDLGALLIKGGYQVRKIKERENGKENGRWVHVITFEGDRK